LVENNYPDINMNNNFIIEDIIIDNKKEKIEEEKLTENNYPEINIDNNYLYAEIDNYNKQKTEEENLIEN